MPLAFLVDMVFTSLMDTEAIIITTEDGEDIAFAAVEVTLDGATFVAFAFFTEEDAA